MPKTSSISWVLLVWIQISINREFYPPNNCFYFWKILLLGIVLIPAQLKTPWKQSSWYAMFILDLLIIAMSSMNAFMEAWSNFFHAESLSLEKGSWGKMQPFIFNFCNTNPMCFLWKFMSSVFLLESGT